MKHRRENKSAVCEHALGGPNHYIRFDKPQILATEQRFIPRMIREAFEIKKYPNFNREDADGDLVIRDVSFTDVGTYRCYANNKFGEKSAFGSLTVKKRTMITDKPETYEVPAGSSATFRCNAHADESLPLEIIWLVDGRRIDFDSQPRYRVTNDYSLLISDTTELDSANYTCIARTPFDEDSADAKLTVQDKPNAPGLNSIRCQGRLAHLSWIPKGDNRAAVLRYSIHYNTSFTPDTWDVANDNVPASQNEWAAPLTPWANYTFR
ncbi:hypothetical protein evm_007468 [Chilo suppressalis]|nr:hypothetical protein evm_007468 [Chilo suppressalis]